MSSCFDLILGHLQGTLASICKCNYVTTYTFVLVSNWDINLLWKTTQNQFETCSQVC